MNNCDVTKKHVFCKLMSLSKFFQIIPALFVIYTKMRFFWAINDIWKRKEIGGKFFQLLGTFLNSLEISHQNHYQIGLKCKNSTILMEKYFIWRFPEMRFEKRLILEAGKNSQEKKSQKVESDVVTRY